MRDVVEPVAAGAVTDDRHVAGRENLATDTLAADVVANVERLA